MENSYNYKAAQVSRRHAQETHAGVLPPSTERRDVLPLPLGPCSKRQVAVDAEHLQKLGLPAYSNRSKLHKPFREGSTIRASTEPGRQVPLMLYIICTTRRTAIVRNLLDISTALHIAANAVR